MTAGAGGSFCVCSGTLVAGRAGNNGMPGCTFGFTNGLILFARDPGASGSPSGGGGCGRRAAARRSEGRQERGARKRRAGVLRRSGLAMRLKRK
jgi:hypothetical protein